MASTWSSLKIELLETGQNPGQWGNLTNVNLGDAVLGEAITGQATVDFASDADVTITLTDSATTQAARNLRLNITESSTGVGSVRNLILGSGCQIEKFYLINNTGTGAKTIKNTSGTGITVPAGKATLVFNNGTNVVDAASYFSSLTLGSALPVASGGTGVTTSTGTTNVVLSNSPTLVTPVLGVATATSLQGIIGNVTPAAGSFTTLGASSTATLNTLSSSGATLTGGTINGMTVGATTPSSGAFTTVTASTAIGTASGGTGLGGATPFTSGGVVYASSTSALATGSALYFDGTNLGVGTTSPYSNAAFSTLTLGGSSSSKTGLIALATSAGTDSAHIDVFNTQLRVSTNGTTNPIVFYTGGGVSEAVRIDSSQNVGIGTSSPANVLNVKSATQYKGVQVNNATNTIAELIGFNAGNEAGGLKLYDSATPKVQLLSNGESYLIGGNTKVLNLGLGNTTPTTSGTGITFPASQSASSDANTLDDYEEGTWTPVVKNDNSTTVTVSVGAARYVKIGKIVNCTLIFDRNDTATLTGAITFDLPFPSNASGSNYASYGTFWALGSGANIASGVVLLDNYANNIGNFAVGYNNVTFGYLNFGITASTVQNGGRVLSSFTYETDV